MEMSINQLMELTGKSFRTIKSRIAKLTPVSEDGRASYYETKDALEAIYQLSELAKENLLLERARREKAEIEVKQLRGEVVSVAEATKTVSKEYSYLRSQFRSIPSKLAKPLSMLADPNEVHVRLSEAIDECLSELQADARFKLEQDRIESLRLIDPDLESDGNDTGATTESSGVGGQAPIPKSRE